MADTTDKELVQYDINLNPETIDEGYLRALGFQLEYILKQMFGGSPISGMVRGTQGQVSSFARALGNERRYLETFEKYGLTDPKTLNNRHKLERAIANFERSTGIKWPFK
jgi:hypothetical protein